MCRFLIPRFAELELETGCKKSAISFVQALAEPMKNLCLEPVTYDDLRF